MGARLRLRHGWQGAGAHLQGTAAVASRQRPLTHPRASGAVVVVDMHIALRVRNIDLRGIQRFFNNLVEFV